MSKYLSVFTTESQYNAASDSLDYPHVSLIDTTGDLHYATYTGQEVTNAPFGSILMADVATNKLFYIDNSEYNLTDYPLGDYKPIAVCIYDKASNANNEAVFMSVQWADYTALGTPKSSDLTTLYGFYNVDLSAKISGIRDTGTNHVSSITINNAMKSLVTVDYSGSSVPDSYEDGNSPALCAAWRFKTAGTQEGDWYIPSYYDSMKYQQNYSVINDIISNIKTLTGSSYIGTVYYSQWTCTEYTSGLMYAIKNDGTFMQKDKKRFGTYYPSVRPVFIPHINEL